VFNLILKSVKDWRVWGLVFSLQLPSLRALFKYLPTRLLFLLPVYFIATFFFYSISLKSLNFSFRGKRILAGKSLALILILILTSANFFVYPIADKLKLQMKGSDQDDALIVSAQYLASGRDPYLAKTYFTSNPLSPGPGWVILNTPFTLTGLYFLLTPFYLFLLAFILRKISGGFSLSNLFLLLCISSPVLWETMVVGSDMFSIGALFVLSVFLLYSGKRPLVLFLSALLFGFAATSRIIFLYLIAIIALFFWKRDGLKGLIYPLVSLVVSLGLHFIFFLWNPHSYTPLHLLGKGNMLLGPGFKLAAVIFTFTALLLALLHLRDKLSSWLFYFWLCVAVPLFFVSLGDLVTLRNYNFSLWEGANYLIVALPIFLTYFCVSLGDYEKN